MHLNENTCKGAIHLTMKEIAPLWCKFNSVEPLKNADLHIQYCEMIQDAIWRNKTSEAFYLLVEGFKWYDSTIDA